MFEVGDLVTGWGRVTSDSEGTWLDLSRMASVALAPSGRGRNSIRLLDADLSLVPTEFGHANSIPGTATVTGQWLGDAIAITEISPAGPVRDPGPTWQRPPCPSPAGGWPDNMNGDYENPAFGLGDLKTSGAAVTVVIFRPRPNQAVVVVAATDPGAVKARLGPQLPGRLCVVTSRWTRQQLDAVREHARQRWDRWGVELVHERIDDNAQPHIEIELVRVTTETAAWAATLPDGLLTLNPILTAPRNTPTTASP